MAVEIDLDQGVLIKLYSGPHAGAEIRLGMGRYVLGRAPACDLILNDTAVAEHHLELTVTEAGIALRPLAAVHCDGREVIEARTVPWYQVITVGTTHFCVGRAAADWPVIRLPPLTIVRPAVARADAGQDGGEPGRACPQTMPSADRPARYRIGALYSWRSGIPVLFIGGLLVLGIGTTYPEPPPVTKAATVEQLSQLIESLGFDHLQVLGEPGKALRIEGYVADSAQKQVLQAALQEVDGPPLQQRVWAGDELVNSARAMLDSLEFKSLEVSAGAPGELRIDGYAGDQAAWRTARETLRRDIPGQLTRQRGINDGHSRRNNRRPYRFCNRRPGRRSHGRFTRSSRSRPWSRDRRRRRRGRLSGPSEGSAR